MHHVEELKRLKCIPRQFEEKFGISEHDEERHKILMIRRVQFATFYYDLFLNCRGVDKFSRQFKTL